MSESFYSFGRGEHALRARVNYHRYTCRWALPLARLSPRSLSAPCTVQAPSVLPQRMRDAPHTNCLMLDLSFVAARGQSSRRREHAFRAIAR